MKNYNLKNDTMNESDLQRVYNYPIYPRDSKVSSDKGFVNIDDGRMSEPHWSCFIVKDKKSLYYDSFGGAPDKLLLNQLRKRIIYHTYKIQDINSKLCGSYCLYFFYFFERMNYYDAILKFFFQINHFSLSSCLLYSYKYSNTHVCIVVIIYILNIAYQRIWKLFK